MTLGSKTLTPWLGDSTKRFAKKASSMKFVSDVILPLTALKMQNANEPNAGLLKK